MTHQLYWYIAAGTALFGILSLGIIAQLSENDGNGPTGGEVAGSIVLIMFGAAFWPFVVFAAFLGALYYAGKGVGAWIIKSSEGNDD